MDLSTKVDTIAGANAGAWMECRDVDGEMLLTEDKAPIRIKLLGKDSDKWIETENQQGNRRLAAGTRMKLTMQGMKTDTIKCLAACTVEWENVGLPGEENSPCNPANALALYVSFPDIRDQADAFVADRSNFSKASSQS